MIKCFFIPQLYKKAAFFFKEYPYGFQEEAVMQPTRNLFFERVCVDSNLRQFRGFYRFIYQDLVFEHSIDVDVPFKVIKVFKLC
jgi:hypothetical protein